MQLCSSQSLPWCSALAPLRTGGQVMEHTEAQRGVTCTGPWCPSSVASVSQGQAPAKLSDSQQLQQRLSSDSASTWYSYYLNYPAHTPCRASTAQCLERWRYELGFWPTVLVLLLSGGCLTAAPALRRSRRGFSEKGWTGARMNNNLCSLRALLEPLSINKQN